MIFGGEICSCPNCGSTDIDYEREDIEYIDWWCGDCNWQGVTEIIAITLSPVVTTTEGDPREDDPRNRYEDPGPTLPGFE